MAIYSLTHYQLVVEIPTEMGKFLKPKEVEKGLVFGGSSSYLESINISVSNDMWSVTGDSTGSYIHTMDANRTGEVSLSISQVSYASKLLYLLSNVYFQKDSIGGAYINTMAFPKMTLMNLQTKEVVAEIRDAFLKKPADKKIGSTAQNEEWSFVCGEVIIKGN